MYVLNFFLSIFPSWFSILNNLLIMNSLIATMKDFDIRFFTMFQFYTAWNYPSNLWFSDVFREYKRRTMGRNKSIFLNHFSPVYLFCTHLWTSENLRSSIISRGYKIRTLRRNGWNYKFFMLIFTQLKNSFFQGGATFINYFRIF